MQEAPKTLASYQNNSLKKMKIRVANIGHKRSQMPAHWRYFISMFANLEDLTFSGVSIPEWLSMLLQEIKVKKLIFQKVGYVASPFNDTMSYLM